MKSGAYWISDVQIPMMRDGDGMPLCIPHGHQMEEIDENIWQCPWAAENERALAAVMADYFATHSVDEILGRPVSSEEPAQEDA